MGNSSGSHRRNSQNQAALPQQQVVTNGSAAFIPAAAQSGVSESIVANVAIQRASNSTVPVPRQPPAHSKTVRRVTCPVSIDKKSLRLEQSRNGSYAPRFSFSCECPAEVAVYFFCEITRDCEFVQSRTAPRHENPHFPAFAARYPVGAHDV